jgi:CheY-like chemotaxis protein
MAKILLVEDDNNLREIYEARLQAEGYDIVAAKDGEEALSIAKKEQPDLIISDVMMPRISGFEMLDILRNTEGLKDVKVIMLTALGQAEDKTRADALGADRYLVKSQVTLEDIVKSASDLLAGVPNGAGEATAEVANAAPTAPAPVTPVATMPVAVAPPAVPAAPVAAPAPVVTPAPAAPVIPVAPANPVAPQMTPPEPPTVQSPPEPAATPPTPVTPPPAPPAAEPTTPPTPAPVVPADSDATAEDKVAASKPLDATAEKASIQAQIDKFAAAPAPGPVPPPPPAPDGDSIMADAVKDLVTGSPTPTDETAPAEPAASSAPVVPPPAPPPPAPVTPPEPAAPAPVDDSVTIAKKKIISPLAPGTVKERANLHDLLAKEGMNLDDAQPEPMPAPGGNPVPGAPNMPHQPGHVISPTPTNSNGQPLDPNSISL